MNPNEIEQFRRLTSEGVTYGQRLTVKCSVCHNPVDRNSCKHHKVYKNGVMQKLNVCPNCQPKKEA